MTSNEDLPQDIPSAPPLATIAQGISDAGEHWAIKVGGTRDDCYTFMDIELPDGQQAGGGGMGGQALLPGRFLNCSVHWWDGSGVSVGYVVGRLHPEVRRVCLEYAGGVPGLDLEPVGESAELGVSFVGAVLPRSVNLVRISAWDGQGELLDQEGTSHYGATLQAGDRGSASPNPTAGEDSGWRPLDNT